MMTYKSDRSGEDIPSEQCSTLRLDGPIRQMVGRGEVHLTKAEGLALAKWLRLPVERPGMETIEGPEPTPAA
jgi:hypothetical protein